MNRPYAEVIGDPIAQSKSPLIHNFWLEKIGLDGDYRATRVTTGELEAYFGERRADPAWRGCNVTMPLKQAIAPLVDSVDEFVSRAGAINTVVRDPGGLRGANSDGQGFLEPLGPLRLSPEGRAGSARLMGTGGAARAIAVALLNAGFHLEVYGRSLARAHDLVTAIASGPEVQARALPDEFSWTIAPHARAQDDVMLLVNATSLGMSGHPPLSISLDRVDERVMVYDIVTSPLETPLLAEARARGMRSFDGLQMLVGQAAVAFERFFGEPAPREHDQELRARLLA